MGKLSVSNDKWLGWDHPIAVVAVNGRSILQRTLEVGNYETVILDKELIQFYPELIEMCKVYVNDVKFMDVHDPDMLVVNTEKELYEYNIVEEHK
jgi:hypothetical protein